MADLEPLDTTALDAALRGCFPGWGDADAPFDASIHSQHLSFTVFFSRVSEVVPRLADFVAKLGLTLFDPQVEAVPADEALRARRLARKVRKEELRTEQRAELADLRSRAEAQDPRAQLDLANRLATGAGVRKNLSEAQQWYRRAAEAGNVDAAFNLAACLQYGDGIGQDVLEAIQWYRRAAEHDKTYATFALGEIHLGFGGVPRDDAQAEAFFRQALEHGHPDARAALELLHEPVITLEAKKRRWKFWNPRA